MARQLTPHQRSRAHAMRAFQRAGKVQYADEQIHREIRLLTLEERHHSRMPASGRVRPKRREPRVRRRSTIRRTKGGSSRDGPEDLDDEPPSLNAVPLSRFRRDVDSWLGAA